MEGWLDASYFHPPAVDAAPYWVFLNKKAHAHSAICGNATTAYAITSAGRTIQITFWLASPPSVSHVCVHDTEGLDSVLAEVSSSAKGLVLLRCSTWREPQDVEHFVYHAGAGKPSLREIPRPPTTQAVEPSSRIIATPCVTLLPFDDDDDGSGGEFLLACLAVVDYPRAYDLHVFSSKTWAWSTRALTSPASDWCQDLPDRSDKVIALGGSVLGWVDLRLGVGIIACDVLDQDPANDRFIPLPKPDFYKRVGRRSPLPVHRDVACYSDGFIVLVDLDLRFRYVALDSNDEKKAAVKTMRDLDHVDDILDSDLIICNNNSPVNVVHVPDGWKIRTCYRHVSWNFWRKGHHVDVDDIAVYDPRHRAMLSELWDGGAGRWTLRKLKAKRPTLSMQRGDVVYLTLVSKKGHNGRQKDHSKKQKQKLTLAVDLGKKTVEMLEPYDDDGHVQPCTFSHLNTPSSPPQNMWNMDGYYNGSFQGYAYAVHADAGYAYDIYNGNSNSLGSGCAYRVNILPSADGEHCHP